MKTVKRILLATFCITAIAGRPAQAAEIIKAHATVYSYNGMTASGTPTRYGIAASGNKDLLGKQIAVYQRQPDDKPGELIGIYTVEDTGCGKNIIDIWCPEHLQKAIIAKTYENGCKGKVYLQIIGGL